MSPTPRQQVLVTAAELMAELGADHPPVVLDVRWHLMDPAGAGRQRYAEGHLPGARFLDLESVLTRHTGDPLDGRHPLPEASTLSGGLGALGVEPADRLVVVDEPGSYAAERAWWVLRWAGLSVRVLDGGVTAWVTAGGDLQPGAGPTPPATSPRVTVGLLPTLTTDEAAAWARTGVLLDARPAPRYRGETEPLDPRAGHLPGAVNLPATTLYAADGTLPDEASLRSALAAVGVDVGDHGDHPTDVAASCGSGVSAARQLLALATLGVDAPLYPGSFSAWSQDPARPVATGADPG
ncbi:sulfurtransferase [Dermatophilaceae bacterium Soc4.6]